MLSLPSPIPAVPTSPPCRLPEQDPTLGDAELHLQVHGRGHHGLGEDQHVLQANHHHQVREDLPGANRGTAEEEIRGEKGKRQVWSKRTPGSGGGETPPCAPIPSLRSHSARKRFVFPLPVCKAAGIPGKCPLWSTTELILVLPRVGTEPSALQHGYNSDGPGTACEGLTH